tara:strand:- start:2193 stop:2495 length:303 start_codon:yes stop_codon:yes gene_type:complete
MPLRMRQPNLAQGFRMKRFLIVDDDLDPVELVTRAFIQGGYDTPGAVNASEAIGATAVGRFDGVILDMPRAGRHRSELRIVMSDALEALATHLGKREAVS